MSLRWWWYDNWPLVLSGVCFVAFLALVVLASMQRSELRDQCESAGGHLMDTNCIYVQSGNVMVPVCDNVCVGAEPERPWR